MLRCTTARQASGNLFSKWVSIKWMGAYGIFVPLHTILIILKFEFFVLIVTELKQSETTSNLYMCVSVCDEVTYTSLYKCIAVITLAFRMCDNSMATTSWLVFTTVFFPPSSVLFVVSKLMKYCYELNSTIIIIWNWESYIIEMN